MMINATRDALENLRVGVYETICKVWLVLSRLLLFVIGHRVAAGD